MVTEMKNSIKTFVNNKVWSFTSARIFDLLRVTVDYVSSLLCYSHYPYTCIYAYTYPNKLYVYIFFLTIAVPSHLQSSLPGRQ